MFTPTSGKLFSSLTVPVTILDWEKTKKGIKAKRIRIFFMVSFLYYVIV